MAKYPQKCLEIPCVTLAVLVVNPIGHLPVTSRGHIMHVFAISMKERSAENHAQAYLSGIFSHKGGSIAILCDNGTEFKITALNEACNQLSIKRIFPNPLHPQGNSGIRNVQLSLGEHLLNV